MKTLNQQIAKAALAGALSFSGLTAQAAVVLPDFTVQPNLGTETSLVGATNPFTADRINGSYNEIITFGATNTFETTILWTASVFRSTDDTTDVPIVNGSGLGVDYGLYALFQGSGTWYTDAQGNHFNFQAGGVFDLYYDNLNNTTFTAPADGTTLWGTNPNNADDKLLITGSLLGAPSSQGLQTPGGGQNLGSFGTTGNIVIQPDGLNFFTAPIPFYELALTSGDFTRFTPQASVTITGITGKLSVDYQRVPEPASLALLGIGMLGMGLSRRKQAQSLSA